MAETNPTPSTAEVSTEAREALRKAQVALAEEIKAGAQALIEESQSKRLAKADDEDMPGEDVPADGGPENEAGPPSAETPAPMEEDAPVSHEELVSMFSEMPPEHRQAYRAALDEVDGGDMGESDEPMEEAEPMAGMGMGGMSAPMMGKSEVLALKTEVAQLRRTVGRLSKSLSSPARVEAPAVRGRAVTGASRQPAPPKPATLSKSEAVAKLRPLVRSTKLSKSDRDLINQFCDGTVPQASIAHLLK